MAGGLVKNFNSVMKKGRSDYSVQSEKNPKGVLKDQFMRREPLLKIEDKDMPIVERLHKSIKFRSRKQMELDQLRELELTIDLM
jgi:hypothetical protein